MRVYVVKDKAGIYCDYKEYIVGVYSDYKKVEKLVTEQKDRIKYYPHWELSELIVEEFELDKEI